MFEINNCHEQRYEKCYLWSYSTFSPSLSISVKYRLMIESSEQSVLILRQTEGGGSCKLKKNKNFLFAKSDLCNSFSMHA